MSGTNGGELETTDVVVIGAGPAGSIAALLLARAGLRVQLFDRKVFPRRKICGACLSEAAVSSLRSIGLAHVLRDAVPLSAFYLASHGQSATVPLRGGCVLSRSVFDVALVDEAVQAGVTFEDGVAAEIGAADSAGRSVALQGMCPDRPAARTLHAKVVVYAGGLAGASFRHDSSLRSTPIATAYIGAGAETTSHAGFYAPGTIYMATHAAGYAGLTHTEDGWLNVAAAIDPRFMTAMKGLGPAVAVIVQQAGFPAEQLAELDWIGTPPLTRRPANVAAERLFLVGDAAGYVEPFTGEGMSWAIAAATHLAPIASEAVRDWSPQYVQTWSRHYRRTIGRRQRVCRVVAYGLRSRLLVSTAIRVLRPFPSAAAPVLRHLATT